MLARAEAPAVKHFVDAVRGAAALVLSTPAYKATYAGALKALVDPFHRTLSSTSRPWASGRRGSPTMEAIWPPRSALSSPSSARARSGRWSSSTTS
jgi:hypothetical protein